MFIIVTLLDIKRRERERRVNNKLLSFSNQSSQIINIFRLIENHRINIKIFIIIIMFVSSMLHMSIKVVKVTDYHTVIERKLDCICK